MEKKITTPAVRGKSAKARINNLEMYQISCKSKADGLYQMKVFLQENNYKYLCHEIENNAIYFLYERLEGRTKKTKIEHLIANSPHYHLNVDPLIELDEKFAH